MIGQIGDGKWDERRITIATVQTLRKRQPPQEFFDDVDLMILDECHHVTAETLMQIGPALPGSHPHRHVGRS